MAKKKENKIESKDHYTQILLENINSKLKLIIELNTSMIEKLDAMNLKWN